MVEPGNGRLITACSKAFDVLPIAGQDLKVFGGVDEIWRRWCSEGPDSYYWKSARYLSKVDRVTCLFFINRAGSMPTVWEGQELIDAAEAVRGQICFGSIAVSGS
jgi:hypothetical protein